MDPATYINIFNAKEVINHKALKGETAVPLQVFKHCTLPSVFKIHTVVSFVVFLFSRYVSTETCSRYKTNGCISRI